MYSLRKPSRHSIEEKFQQFRGSSKYSYPEVGLTHPNRYGSIKEELDKSYTIRDNRLLLGSGQDLFDLACLAIDQMKMFDLRWVESSSSSHPVVPGTIISISVKALGIWIRNFAKVIYSLSHNIVNNDIVPHERIVYGFAYGTLEEHVEMGEELFTIEYDYHTEKVYYRLLSFSRQRHFLSKVGWLYANRKQDQFVLDSYQKLQNSISK